MLSAVVEVTTRGEMKTIKRRMMETRPEFCDRGDDIAVRSFWPIDSTVEPS